MNRRDADSSIDHHTAATKLDYREAADYVVEHDDIATAANLLRTAQDEIDRLRYSLQAILGVPFDVNTSPYARASEIAEKALNRG